MSKSAKLLHLDPFAAAIARKEREAGGQSEEIREAANTADMGGQSLLIAAPQSQTAGGNLLHLDR